MSQESEHSCARLFSEIEVGGVTLSNRVGVSPMCQYSAIEGCASEWHMAHLGYLSGAGAGLVMTEATAISPGGRITKSCLGLYNDACEEALARVVHVCRQAGNAAIGIQLGHAGRKGALTEPWSGGAALPPEDAWETLAPSSCAFSEKHAVPREATASELKALIEDYRNSALRAKRIGFDVLEIHAAHGYLLHTFLSPLANMRGDDYGGSLENRMRFPLEVVSAIRSIWPTSRAFGVRISGNDWIEGGAEIGEAIVFAEKLKSAGCDYVTVSSGGISPDARITVAPGYQVPYARKVSDSVDILVGAVGMITTAAQAGAVLDSGAADLVFIGRGFLNDPHFLWRAVDLLPGMLSVPRQYLTAAPGCWPPVV